MKQRAYREKVLGLLNEAHRNGEQVCISDLAAWCHDANYQTVRSEVIRLEREAAIKANRQGRFKPTLLQLV